MLEAESPLHSGKLTVSRLAGYQSLAYAGRFIYVPIDSTANGQARGRAASG